MDTEQTLGSRPHRISSQRAGNKFVVHQDEVRGLPCGETFFRDETRGREGNGPALQADLYGWTNR